MYRLLFVVLLFSRLLAGQTEQEWMDRGIQAFRSAQYPDAVAAFQRAVELNARSVRGWLYLGTAQMQQHIPGSEAADNAAHADAAAVSFQRVLGLDAGNKVALASLASLSLNRKRWEESRGWYRRLLAVDPSEKTAYYSMAFSVWAEWYPAYGQARTSVGMRPETPGPIANPAVRDRLRAQWGPAIDEAMANLRRALELDPEYADAMAYLNLFIRERADLLGTVGEYEQAIAEADLWVQRALAAKKKQREAREGFRAAPPLPPPPPGSGSGMAQRIRVGSIPLTANLIRKVEPVYPEAAREARIEGTVRLDAVIGKDGTIGQLGVISGHPLLAPAAIDAVKQWIYRPTLLNGEPVEVKTQIDVNFRLPN